MITYPPRLRMTAVGRDRRSDGPPVRPVGVSALVTGPDDPDGAGDAGPAEPAVAVRHLVQVLLVVVQSVRTLIQEGSPCGCCQPTLGPSTPLGAVPRWGTSSGLLAGCHCAVVARPQRAQR